VGGGYMSMRDESAPNLCGDKQMPFIDTNELKTIERLPGWKGKYFD
jgi:hypothetical protein